MPVSDIVCMQRDSHGSASGPDPRHTPTKIARTIDNSHGLSLAIFLKYSLILMAALALPFVFFKFYVLPLAMLFILKKLSLLHTILLGSLLLKPKHWKHIISPGYFGYTMGFPTIRPIRNSFALRYTFNCILFKCFVYFNEIEIFCHRLFSFSTENSIEVTESDDDDLTRTEQLAKKKNKKWWKSNTS